MADKLHELGGVVGVRPEDVIVNTDWTIGSIKGTLKDVQHNPLRRQTILTIAVGDNELIVKRPLEQELQFNDTVYVNFSRYHLFDQESGLRVRTFVSSD